MRRESYRKAQLQIVPIAKSLRCSLCCNEDSAAVSGGSIRNSHKVLSQAELRANAGLTRLRLKGCCSAIPLALNQI